MLKIKPLVDLVEYDSDDSVNDGHSKTLKSVPSNFKASSSSHTVDLDDFLVVDSCGVTFNDEKEVLRTDARSSDHFVDKNLRTLLSRAVCKPDIEMTERNKGLLGNRAQKRLKKLELEKTAGKKWFDMPATEITDEVRMDLELLQMRRAIDPLAFYRKDSDEKLPKYFQVGRVVDAPEDYYSGRLTKAQRKRNMLDEFLHNDEFMETKSRIYDKLKSNEGNRVKGITMAKKFKRKNPSSKNTKKK